MNIFGWKPSGLEGSCSWFAIIPRSHSCDTTFCCRINDQLPLPGLSPSRMPMSTDSFRTSTKNSSWVSNCATRWRFIPWQLTIQVSDREMGLSKNRIYTPKFDKNWWWITSVPVEMAIWGVNPSNMPKYDQNGRGPMNVQCQVQMPRWRQAISERCDKTGLRMSVWLNHPTSPISMVPALVVPCVSNLLHDPYTFLHALASKHIYIYTANASALPGTATTAGNASSSSPPQPPPPSSSSLNPYWRSSMNVEV